MRWLALIAALIPAGRAAQGTTDSAGVELFAPGVISTGDFELGITFSPDGNEAVFAKLSPNFTTSVLVSARLRGGKWSAPEVLPFAGPYRDLEATLSPDGRRLFFQSDRALTGSEPKDWDIWMSERGADGRWGAPRNLGAPINTASVETYPFAAADGALYFASDRPGGQGLDIYRAREVNGRFESAENVGPPLNGESGDSNFAFSPDGKMFVKSASDYPGHRGEGDLYASYLHEGKWSAFEHLGDVNTPAREFAPSFSPDGKYLYFTSNRGGGARDLRHVCGIAAQRARPAERPQRYLPRGGESASQKRGAPGNAGLAFQEARLQNRHVRQSGKVLISGDQLGAVGERGCIDNGVGHREFVLE